MDGAIFLRRGQVNKEEIELVYRGDDSDEDEVLYSLTEHVNNGVDDAEPLDERIKLEELSRLVGFMQTSYEPSPRQRT